MMKNPTKKNPTKKNPTKKNIVKNPTKNNPAKKNPTKKNPDDNIEKNPVKNPVKNPTKNPTKIFFTLDGISIKDVERRYNLLWGANLDNINNSSHMKDAKQPPKTTLIDELNTYTKKQVVSFLDESKQEHKCEFTMIDISGLTIKHGYHCYWCRHSIPLGVNPIGCPLSYVPYRNTKTYYSEISKDTFRISENITPYKKLDKLNDQIKTSPDGNYYYTDGIFCSFNCTMAWIFENKKNPTYSKSEMLLLKMYSELNNDAAVAEICRAPHWRLLKIYGGKLTINEFRKSFNHVKYELFGFCKPMALLFEEHLKF